MDDGGTWCQKQKMAVVDEWRPNTLGGDEAAEVHRPSHGSLAETIAANRQRKDVSNDMLFIVLD